MRRAEAEARIVRTHKRPLARFVRRYERSQSPRAYDA